jgi:hypothetical protein
VEGRAGHELDRPFGEGPEAEFWSLQIGENADRSSCCVFHPPDRRKPGAVILVCTMAKIEPEDIDARLEQRADPIRG